jgi:iron complex transport system ATP-binding protein
VPGPDLREANDGLVLSGVTAGYGAGPVVDAASLHAPPGEVTGLIGPNGSGKTTLIRVSSRGLAPVEGTVRLNGTDPYAVSARAAARLVAVVPQEVAPAFSYTVLEMALMGRSPYMGALRGGGAEDWAKARWAMAAANVQHLADRPIDELSGGERQSVILAQALAQDAPVLLLDEPTTHLDLRHVVETLSLVRGLARSGRKAVLAIFHDLNLASAYCDRIYAMASGRVVSSGPPGAVLTRGLLADVFGVEAEVTLSGATGRPAVVLPPPMGLAPTASGRAHVIGGAGRGASVIRSLVERGFEVTVGVLHAGDTDAGVAERLNLIRVTVPAFSPIDARSASDCAELIAGARLLVVCDAPFGPGNVDNLRLALAAASQGIRTFLIEQVPIEERDFTGGEAKRLWFLLRDRAEMVGSEDELLREVSASR